MHGVAENQELTLKILKDLNKNYGLKNFIGEVGYLSAWMLNGFIESGDEQLLNIVLESSIGTFFGTEDSEWFFRSLREYNLSLPEAQSLEYIGLDLDHKLIIALRHLADIAERTEGAAPEKLLVLLDQVSGFLESEDISKLELYDGCIKNSWDDYCKNKTSYLNWCGTETVAELELTLQN